MNTFASRVDAAVKEANDKASPFAPSPAEYEAALTPLVNELVAMGREAAFVHIGKSVRSGTNDVRVIMMLKERLDGRR